MHIFVAEDEKTIRRELTILLENAMYQVTAPENFENIPDWITEASPDLILLDVNLPGMSGFDICTSLRQRENTCPVIFLTSRTDSMDELNGMLRGGDDYITKPFKLAIFMSRINALLRRSENFNTSVTELSSNDISIRLLKGEVYKQGKLLDLTASEYKLLCLFMENPDQILSSEQILGNLWDCNENYIDNNSLTVYIRRLRTKIEDNPGEPKRIVTVRGMGYKWNTEEAKI